MQSGSLREGSKAGFIKAKKNGATVRKGGRADSFYFKDSR